MPLREFHLVGPGYSGRGVRVRDLTPDELDEAGIEAAREHTGEASDVEGFVRLKIRKILYRIVVAVTAPDVGAKEAKEAREKAMVAVAEEHTAEVAASESAGPDQRAKVAAKVAGLSAAAGDRAATEARDNAFRTTTWQPVTNLDLSMGGPRGYNTLFTVKDHELLTALYKRFYSATNVEAESILGKALMVSEG